MSRPSVVCLSSVTLVHPTQAVELFGNFFHHTIAEGLYFSGAKNRWWGTPLSPWNLRSKWPTPFQTAKLWQISAHSASTVIASEKSSISTYRKSTTRFPTSHRWTVYVTPKSPTNNFCHLKSRVPGLSYGEKKLPKSSTAWVECTNVTDRRQTDRRQTDRQTVDRRTAHSK